MSSHVLFRVSALAAAVCFLPGCKPQQRVESSSGPPPVPVSLARAVQEPVGFQVRVVGTVDASSTVQVKSQVAGELLRVHFAEGENVEKGALLFEIDSRPYREALRQAEAALARDTAQLRQAEAVLSRDRAQAKNADSEAERYNQLMDAGVISRSQHDQVRTSAEVSRESVRAAEAAIESIRAAIQSDEAAIDKAKLDISYCQIVAPIAGRTGNLLVNAGNLVRANGDSPLVVIHQVAPIFVNFSVPESHLATVRRLGTGGKLQVGVSSQDDPERAVAGHVSVIDNTVDRTTGTIRLKATLNNSDGYFWPGEFVNVVLTLGAPQPATVVPSEAVQVGQQGSYIYVVRTDGSVEPRVVTAGRTLAGKVVIESGIAPGDTVVVDGQLRLFPGARIRAVDAQKLEGIKL